MKKKTIGRNFKIILVGDDKTGKTSILQRYDRNFFPYTYYATYSKYYHLINIHFI